MPTARTMVPTHTTSSPRILRKQSTRRTPEIEAKRRSQLEESFTRIKRVPELIKGKQASEITMELTRQVQLFGRNVEFFSGPVGGKDYLKGRELIQSLATLGV